MNKIIAAAIAAALAGPASAALLDFNSAPMGSSMTYAEDGFQIRAASGVVFVANPTQPGLVSPDGTPFMGWVSGLSQEVGLPRLRLDHFGAPFTLESFDTLGVAPPGLLTSSKGGSLGLTGNSHFDLLGPEWNGVEWVEIFLGGPTGDHRGWDNISVTPSVLSSPAAPNTIPEPSTLALLALGAVGLGMLHRRQK